MSLIIEGVEYVECTCCEDGTLTGMQLCRVDYMCSGMCTRFEHGGGVYVQATG